LQPRPPKPTLFPYTTLFRSLTNRSSNKLAKTIRQNQQRIDYHPPPTEQFTSKRSREGRISRKQYATRYPVKAGDPVSQDVPLSVDRKSTRLNSSHVKISYAV